MKKEDFLYERVYNETKQKIISGELKKGSLLPSEKELSQDYNVNRTTIRKALLLLVADGLVVKKPGIGTQVFNNEEFSKTQKENLIKKFETSEGGTIGLFVPPAENKKDRISQPFYSEILFFVERELNRFGYSVFYSSLDESKDFENLLNQQKLDGIIFVSNISQNFIDITKKRNIPSLIVNNYNPLLFSILADNVSGMEDITQYLISMGHKKFAVFTGLTDYISTKERLTGCLAGFSKNNITDYKIYNMDWNPYKAYERAKVLFKEEKELPTAIICFNDNIAFGCIRAAREFGLQVPEDLSIVGFDNIDQSRYFSPTLTTVNSNIDQISQLAVQNILCQINNPNLSYIYKAIIPHTLKIRESSSAPPTQKVVIKKKY